MGSIFKIAESRVFDDSEDEFEDDFTESIKLINDLEDKMDQKSKFEQNSEQNDDPLIIPLYSKNRSSYGERSVNKSKPNKACNIDQEFIGSTIRTRSSLRRQNISETKNDDSKNQYELNGPIEVLMEEIDNEEVEYVIAPIDDIPDDQFQSSDSDDEMVDENDFERESFILENVKIDELDVSEESMDAILESEDTGKFIGC